MDPDCAFCSIVDNKLDSYTVLETDRAEAFLDLNPVSRGHTLVIPRTHAEDLTDLDEEETAALFTAVRQVAERLEAGLDPDGINILHSSGEAAGQEIFHVHVHVIPRYEDDGLSLEMASSTLDDAEAREILDTVGQ